MIEDFRAVEKGKIVGAVLNSLERLVRIVGVELDPPFRAKQRRADRTTEVEVEASRNSPVGRLPDEPGTRDAASADDTAGLDPIDDRPGVRRRRR
jgi:hypothetical protein